jgi:hypothetical protein
MRLINHASGFNRYVANSPARPACTLGGRYPHHCTFVLVKSRIVVVRTRLLTRSRSCVFSNPFILEKKNHFVLTKHKIFIPLLPNPCHAWVLNISRLISSSLYSNTPHQSLTLRTTYTSVVSTHPPTHRWFLHISHTLEDPEDNRCFLLYE